MKRFVLFLWILPQVLTAAPLWQVLGNGLNGTCITIVKDQQGRLYAGGDFSQAGGLAANNIAVWDGLRWKSCGSGLNGICRSIAVDGSGNVYAGGDFTTAGGIPCSRIAMWDGVSWTAMNSGFNNTVRSICVGSGGEVYAGGTFTKSGSNTLNRLARWNGSSWQAVGGGLSGSCYAIVISAEGNLIAGGSFATAGGTLVNNIAKWDGMTWVPFGSGLSNTCRALAISSTAVLYAGGDFVQAGGIMVNRIALWNGSNWTAMPGGAGIGLSGGSLSCQSISIDGEGTVYAGGGFLFSGGVLSNHFARWKAGAWTAFGNGVDNVVSAVFADDCGRVFVGSSSANVSFIQGFNTGLRLWGQLSVGNGGDFPDLTGDNGLFHEINSQGINGAVSAIIISDLNEGGLHPLNAIDRCGAGDYLISIKPQTNVERLIVGNCSQGLLRFSGTRHISLAGGIGYSLRIRNTNLTGSAILLNSVDDVSIRHCVLEGRDTSYQGGVVVAAAATNGQLSSNVTIDSNRFMNFPRNGIFVRNNNGSGWRISANDYYNNQHETSGNPVSVIGFKPGIQAVENAIMNNRIGGSLPFLQGDAWDFAGSAAFCGISVNAGYCCIDGNSISNIVMSHPGLSDFVGIESISGVARIGSPGNGNTIGSATQASSIALAGNSNFFGIRLMSDSPGNVIEGNFVRNIQSTCSQAYINMYGIFFRSGNVFGNRIYKIGTLHSDVMPSIFGILNLGSQQDTNIVANNMIALDGGNAVNPKIFGIQDNVISATVTGYLYNTVLINGPTAIKGGTYAFHRNFSGHCILRNNILLNLRDGLPYLHYSIYTGTTIDNFDSDYNDLYAGQNGVGFCNCTYCQLISDWQLQSGGDVHSIAFLPTFLSSTDLHLQSQHTTLRNKGTAIPAVVRDIDGQMRDTILPTIGADE